MLKKLFSRKKIAETAKPVKSTPVEATPSSLADWVLRINDAQGKSQSQWLNKLVERIEAKEFPAEDAVQQLSGLPAVMVALQLDQPSSSITADQYRQLVTQGFTAKVRIAAAEKIETEADLSALAKDTKGKDKSVHRILHDKLNAVHHEQKVKNEWHIKKASVLDAINKLAESSIEPLYEAKLKGLVDQWKGLKVTDASDNTRFSSAEQAAKLKLQAVTAQENAKQVVDDTVKMADSNRQDLVDSLTKQMLHRIDTLDFSDEAIAEDQHLIADLQHQWREIDEHSKASKEESRSFHKASTAFEVGLPKLKNIIEKHGDIDSIVKQVSDPESDHEQLLHDVDDWVHEIEFILAVRTPEPVAQLKVALDHFQKSLAKHRQEEIDKVRAIRGQIRRCLSAVEEGSLRRASGLFHGVEEKLEGFDLTHHAGIRKQLDETTEALEKLRDWQSYAVLPKKEALIRRMTALVGQSIDPESRAQSIRDMQDEWKLLSRGLQNRQQDLWDTFHDLAQKAYEPCKEFFSEQRNLRDVNLDRRKDVVAQLITYSGLINWDAPDVKEIDRILQVARNDWRHYAPVDRVANKPVQKEFDQLHKSLFDKLRSEQDVFKDNKLGIIEKAKTLLELEDVKDATEQAKKLQREWKDAGIVARKDEQELWKAFREVCDQLFEKREQQITAFKADLDTNKEKAESVIKSIVELASSNDVLAEQSVFENLKEQYSEIGTLPKAQYQKLTQQYKDACGSIDRARKQARVDAADQHWISLFDWVKEVRFGGGTLDEANEQLSQLKLPGAAKGIGASVSAWLKPADEINSAAMHEKTIDLEIFTSTDSPAADSQMRLNLQVQRLAEGIGASATQGDLDSLVVEWLALGSVEKSAYEGFETRMKAARTNLMK